MSPGRPLRGEEPTVINPNGNCLLSLVFHAVGDGLLPMVWCWNSLILMCFGCREFLVSVFVLKSHCEACAVLKLGTDEGFISWELGAFNCLHMRVCLSPQSSFRVFV